eukprot:PhM_4_TR6226/c0_g1_i1/m.74755
MSGVTPVLVVALALPSSSSCAPTNNIIDCIQIPPNGTSVTVGRGGPTPQFRRLMRRFVSVPRAAATVSTFTDGRLSVQCLRGALTVHRTGDNNTSSSTTTTVSAGTTTLLAVGDKMELNGSGVTLSYHHMHPTSLASAVPNIASDQLALFSELLSLKRRNAELVSMLSYGGGGSGGHHQAHPNSVLGSSPSLGNVAASLAEDESYSGADFADAVLQLERALITDGNGSGGSPEKRLKMANSGASPTGPRPSSHHRMGAVGAASAPNGARKPTPYELLESQVVVFEHE